MIRRLPTLFKPATTVSADLLIKGLQEFRAEKKAELLVAKQKKKELLDEVNRCDRQIDGLEKVLSENMSAERNVVKDASEKELKRRQDQSGYPATGFPDPDYSRDWANKP